MNNIFVPDYQWGKDNEKQTSKFFFIDTSLINVLLSCTIDVGELQLSRPFGSSCRSSWKEADFPLIYESSLNKAAASSNPLSLADIPPLTEIFKAVFRHRHFCVMISSCQVIFEGLGYLFMMTFMPWAAPLMPNRVAKIHHEYHELRIWFWESFPFYSIML